MNFLKALVNWKVWLSVILGLATLGGVYFLTFKWLDEYTHHGIELSVPDLSKMKIQEAMATLDEMGLTYSVDSAKFDEGIDPYAVIDFYPIEGAKVKPGRKIFIRSNPSDYAPVELPKVIDRSKRMAFAQLAMRDIFVGDTIYEEDPAKDVVLRVLYNNKEIKPGTLLPRGAKVTIVLGRGYNVDVDVPDLLGLNLNEVKMTLRERHFSLGNIYYLGSTADSVMLRVVYQDPPSTDLYDEGLPISIWLSDRERDDLRHVIDSLDIKFKRKLSVDDSLYYKSVQKSKDININDLPEEIRNQVRSDERAKNNMELNRRKNTKKTSKIDTTGISID